MTLSNSPLTPSANPTSLTFQLKSDAGAQANFNGFTEVRFYETDLKTVIATVSLPQISGSGTGGTGGTSNSADTPYMINLLDLFLLYSAL